MVIDNIVSRHLCNQRPSNQKLGFRGDTAFLRGIAVPLNMLTSDQHHCATRLGACMPCME